MMRRYAAAAIAAVVITAIFFLFLLSPKLKEIKEVRAEIETAQDEGQTLRNRLRQLRAAQQTEPTTRARLAVFDRLLPPTPDLPSLIRQLQTAASASGIDLRSLAPSPPTDLTGRPGVQSVSVTVQVVGGFFRLQSFLTRLEELQRVVEVNAISISSGTDETTGLSLLSSTITFRMYVVQPNASPGGAAPAPAPTSPPTSNPTPASTTPPTPTATPS
jgi:Tfp pilus assembly protein PilO